MSSLAAVEIRQDKRRSFWENKAPNETDSLVSALAKKKADKYDRETDTLTITLRDARVKESDEIRPGVIADFGYDGGVVGFEILQASKVVEHAGEMQFAVAG